MKLADIPPGTDTAYRSAAKTVAEQVEFELETCRRPFGDRTRKGAGTTRKYTGLERLPRRRRSVGFTRKSQPLHFASNASSQESKNELRYMWPAY
jgi:hypothetical protein